MIKIQSLTIADLVRGQKNVNLTNLAQQRNMLINGFRLHDGSSAKLLTNDNEIDCIIMKNGKVLSAHGTFVKSQKQLRELFFDAISRLVPHTESTTISGSYKADYLA